VFNCQVCQTYETRTHIVISITSVVVECVVVSSCRSHIVVESQLWYRQRSCDSGDLLIDWLIDWLTGHKLFDRLVPGTTETRDVPVGGGHRAAVRQHPGDRTVSEAVSSQPRAGRRTGSSSGCRFQRRCTLQGCYFVVKIYCLRRGGCFPSGLCVCVQNISKIYEHILMIFSRKNASEKSISFWRGSWFFRGSWIIFQDYLPILFIQTLALYESFTYLLTYLLTYLPDNT